MAEKYQPEGSLPTARDKLIERATAALDEARDVLDWAQDNAHGKEHWEQLLKERARYEAVRAGLEAAAAIPDAPIQAAAAEGYRDLVVGRHDWRDTEAEVVAAPPPRKADAPRTVRAARHMLRLVRGGLHAPTVYTADVLSKGKDPRAGVPALIAAMVNELQRRSVDEIRKFGASLLGRDHPSVRDL